MGRPSKFTKKLADAICVLLERGDSLRDICAMPDMPDKSTIQRWLKNNESFRDQYAQARESYNDDEFDAMDKLDLMLLEGKIEANAHRSLIDSKKWRIMKRNPKKYGDKVNHEVGGNGGGEIVIRLARPDELSAEDREASGRGD